MPFILRTAASLVGIMLITLVFPMATMADSGFSQTSTDDWPESDDSELPVQVGPGELTFLQSPPAQRVLHSDNRIHITSASLRDGGWVRIEQCYRGLDAVEKTEILYRYNEMRDLRIISMRNIRAAAVDGHVVRLDGVGAEASLCVVTAARILQAQEDGRWRLRNGPFQRRYLDGFFPMHVSMTIDFPGTELRFLDTQPGRQPGFAVAAEGERIDIDSWFAGSLIIEILFESVTRP